MSHLRIAISGAAGRMGKRLVALTIQDTELTLSAAIDAPSHPLIGQDAGNVAGESEEVGVAISGDLNSEVDAMIDFSVPAGAERAVDLCVDRGIPLVMATTGLSEDQEAEDSQGCRTTSGRLGSEYEHGGQPDHEAGRDCRPEHLKTPMPTSKSWSGIIGSKKIHPAGQRCGSARIIANAMGITEHRHGREGRPGARPHNEIGYHAIRVGDNPGEHTMVFGMLGETIELTVRASNRDCYAAGALAAAKFVSGKQPGLYDMFDVLGLKD